MNLGILKSYKFLILLFTILLGTSSCSIKYDFNLLNDTKDDTNKKEIKQEIKKDIKTKEEFSKDKVIVEKKPLVPIENKNKITNDKPVVKRIVIQELNSNIKKEKIIEPKKDEKKAIIKQEPQDAKNEDKPLHQSTKLIKANLKEFNFDFIKKGVQDDNTLLIVGGIQGDEPGGFMAASLIATHYTITKGSVWIVPNLNFYSIIKRSRGPFGDMNRKFAKLSKNDPDYETVQRIKKYITDPDVKLILNLHDGSGFYRPMYLDKNHQPGKWGQCLVIDQEILPGVKEYADTYVISEQVSDHLNKYLLKEEDIYRTKNTHTRFNKTAEEQDMAKTLTYYAVTNGKSAFGHETSKSLPIPHRVYYKLLAMEKFMDIMGIEYTKKFEMNIKDIKKVLNDDISIKFDDTDVRMPLKDIRNIQKYFPINKDGVIKYLPSNPLIKIIKNKNEYTIYYGNRRLTKLQADYAEHLNFNTKVDFIIDGKAKTFKFGDTIEVKKDFLINPTTKYRVNVIGYKSKTGLETNKKIRKKEFIKRYSIEKKANIYRIEFYKKKKFAGMILIKYI